MARDAQGGALYVTSSKIHLIDSNVSDNSAVRRWPRLYYMH